MRAYLPALALVLQAPPPILAQAAPRQHGQPLRARADGWTTATAEAAGLDARRLAALAAAVRAWPELGVHAILIERSGRLVYEEYFDGFDERWGIPRGRVSMGPDSLHDLRSVTKSVVSALAGLALADGAITSLDQPVVDWFPEYSELNTAAGRRLTLRHLLGMTSGLAWDESVPYSDPRNDEIGMTRDPQPLRYVLSRAATHDPGVEFNYNGGLVMVVTILAGRYNDFTTGNTLGTRILREHVIPAVRSGFRAGCPGA